jgi:molybdate transport system substrate-binding protein
MSAAAVLATGLVFAAGCSSSDSASESTTSAAAATSAGGEVTGEITVFAAASLNSTFTELGKTF